MIRFLFVGFFLLLHSFVHGQATVRDLNDSIRDEVEIKLMTAPSVYQSKLSPSIYITNYTRQATAKPYYNPAHGSSYPGFTTSPPRRGHRYYDYNGSRYKFMDDFKGVEILVKTESLLTTK